MEYRILPCPFTPLQQKPLLLPSDALAFLVSVLTLCNMDACEEAVGAEILAAWVKAVLCSTCQQSASSGQGWSSGAGGPVLVPSSLSSLHAGPVHGCHCPRFTLVLVSSSLLVLGLPDSSRDCCWSWSCTVTFFLPFCSPRCSCFSLGHNKQWSGLFLLS